ncbi:MAG: Uma2 family endonuclease [Gemmataceae bacterium]|nr:Uma2 family endonuclease [Gemmataceae bacterium]
MPRTIPRPILEASYERSADLYMYGLDPEKQMEPVPQSVFKFILLAAFRVMALRRPEIQAFAELLIQYDHGKPPRRRGVVPDVFIVRHAAPIEAVRSYNLPMQPARPFLVAESVSKSSERKDHETSFDKYEQELKVPYLLYHYPDNEEMTLFRLRKGKYASVKPNRAGRVSVPELEMEFGFHAGQLRVWFQGEMMPLPEEMHARIESGRAELSRLEEENERLRAEVARLKG